MRSEAAGKARAALEEVMVDPVSTRLWPEEFKCLQDALQILRRL